VLAAIDLHNEALFKADEVNYITIARSLPTEGGILVFSMSADEPTI
jgi:hypothetical protein